MKFKLSKKEEGSLNLPKPINQAYIHVLQGREKIVCNNNKITTMSYTENNNVYFDDIQKFYKIISYSWNGPVYQTITTSDTIGTNDGKVKRKGRVTGAVIGTLILPGVGTVVGAMHGTGNKKIKGSNQSHTISKDNKIEDMSPATMVLKDISNNEKFSIVFSCDSKINARILPMLSLSEETSDTSETSVIDNPYDELKKLKELLDMDIITQEEFDKKKKELLGL